jgi:hypothetical protein
MSTKERKQIEARIRRVKERLLEIGQMRPGSLTVQYKRPKDRKGAYYQLSYTHRMRSRTEYVRPEFAAQIRKQIATYKEFRKLVDSWVELAIEHSRLKMNKARMASPEEKDEKPSRPPK